MSELNTFQSYLDEARRDSLYAAPVIRDQGQAILAAADMATQLSTLKADLDTLISKTAANNAIIQNYNAAIKGPPKATGTNLADLIAARAPYLTIQTQLTTATAIVSDQIKQVTAHGLINPTYFAAIDKLAAAAPFVTSVSPGYKKITYNVGSVTEAYFNGKSSFLKELAVLPGNKPTAVTTASELWVNGVGNKGMISTWAAPDAVAQYATDPVTGNMIGASTSLKNSPHAFQFQYNPTSVSMQYSGTPEVDLAYEASGKDKFNFAGTGVTQATIGFQILINRVYDMKYYTTEGYLKANAGKVYSPVPPTPAEQQAIYNKGTMYDLEFLLRTLLGLTMPSYLRGEDTADMGFVAATPVELHLGRSLRYVVMIGGLSVNHALFNERMVPLFTTVDISCNRLPDFAALSKEFTDAKNQPIIIGGGVAVAPTGPAKPVNKSNGDATDSN